MFFQWGIPLKTTSAAFFRALKYMVIGVTIRLFFLRFRGVRDDVFLSRSGCDLFKITRRETSGNLLKVAFCNPKRKFMLINRIPMTITITTLALKVFFKKNHEKSLLLWRIVTLGTSVLFFTFLIPSTSWKITESYRRFTKFTICCLQIDVLSRTNAKRLPRLRSSAAKAEVVQFTDASNFLLRCDTFRLPKAIKHGHANPRETTMRENRLLHLFRVCNITSFVNKSSHVTFDSCSHPISRSLSTLGIWEAYHGNFYSCCLLYCWY